MKRILFALLSVGLLAGAVSAAGQFTWSRLGRLQGNAGPQPYVATIAAHPTDAGVLYVGSIAMPGGALVYRSDDGGKSWRAAAAGLPADLPLNTGVRALVIRPDAPETVYAALHRRGVWRTDNGGDTWQQLTGGSLSADEDISALLAVTPAGGVEDEAAGGVVYALSSEGLNVLNGESWRATNKGLPKAGAVYNALAVDPTNPRRLYVATSPTGLYRSTNGGQRWTRANGDLPGGDVRNVKGVVVAADGEVFVSLRGAGIYRSRDGETWTPANTGLTFTTTLFGTVSAPLFDPADPAVAYAINADGLFRSDDGGATWAKDADGLALTAVVSTVAFQPARPNAPLVGTAASGVWARVAEEDPPPPPPAGKFAFVPMVRK